MNRNLLTNQTNFFTEKATKKFSTLSFSWETKINWKEKLEKIFVKNSETSDVNKWKDISWYVASWKKFFIQDDNLCRNTKN